MALPQTNLTMSAIRDALGESTLSLSALCTSSKINKWAKFRPGDFNLTASDPMTAYYPIAVDTAPYNMGDFRGYNHYAKPPTYFESCTISSTTVEVGKGITVYSSFARGERTPVGSGSWDGLKTQLFIGTTLKDTSAIASVPETGLNRSNSYTFPIIGGNTTYTVTVKPWYCDPIEGAIFGMIEDGSRSFTVTVTPIQYTVTLTLLDSSVSNGEPLHYNLSITRSGDADSKYFRLNINGLNITKSLGLLSFTAGETKTFTNQYIMLNSQSGGTPGNKTVLLEISTDAAFTVTNDFTSTNNFYYAGGGA